MVLSVSPFADLNSMLPCDSPRRLSSKPNNPRATKADILQATQADTLQVTEADTLHAIEADVLIFIYWLLAGFDAAESASGAIRGLLLSFLPNTEMVI